MSLGVGIVENRWGSDVQNIRQRHLRTERATETSPGQAHLVCAAPGSRQQTSFSPCMGEGMTGSTRRLDHLCSIFVGA